MSWTLVGRFHPLLVHLPIGFLIIACLLDWLSFRQGFKKLKLAVRITLMLGFLAASVSCITGYFLSQSGEYDATLVSRHQWFGISTMILSFAYWQAKRQKVSPVVSKTFSVVTLIVLSVTGHLGGSLTHGEGYLTEPLTQEKTTVDFTSVDLSKAIYYTDLVQPILKARCYSCHGESKQKGKLRLDMPESILAGGKHGKTVVKNHSDESELINRLLLPLNEKNHMPPKEKPQPSPIEIEILKNWIELGADFSKSVQTLGAVNQLQKVLASTAQQTNELDEEVKAADESTLDRLRKNGVVIQEIADGNHHLTANFVNAQPMDASLALLVNVKEQLVWLKANSSLVTDVGVESISRVDGLRKLDLSHAKITARGIASLKKLPHLSSLNLSFTEISADAVRPLAAIPTLKELFLFNTKITEGEILQLKKDVPLISFEMGNYQVPTLNSDTTLVTPPKDKK